MGQEKVVLEVFKLAHHDSTGNLSKQLLEQIDCTRYPASTDGSGYLHPDHQALLRILRYSATRPWLGVSVNHVHGFGRLILQNVGRQSIEYAEHLRVSSPRADDPGHHWITTVGHRCHPYDRNMQIIQPMCWLLEPVRFPGEPLPIRLLMVSHLEGLKQAKLFKDGTCHVDLLKLPHHGSDHNVSTEFFRQVTADHYVVSGNGEHGNPEIATLQMLSDARGQDEFTLYLTNEEPRLTEFFQQEKAKGKQYTAMFRKKDALSISANLGDDLED